MSNVKRVTLNTVFQYSKLIISVFVNLISVRLIYKALGADDYGIYDVVGGVVALLGFISSSLSMTSTRFISVSLGKNDSTITKNVFSCCFWIHIIIALFLVAVLECLAPFLFNGFLNIPASRISVAQHIYQFMLVTLFFNISMTPFLALITSHENFLYIVIVGLIDSFGKLGIAYAITVFRSDKLLLYGVLMAAISGVNFLLYAICCFIRYKNNLRFSSFNFKYLREVATFASWTILDVLGSIIPRQGYSIMLNRFFGTSMNAVFAISRQVEGLTATVSSSAINTIKPQIMKSHGANDDKRMFRLSFTAGKMGTSLMAFITIPLFVFTEDILSLWLGDVPVNTSVFCRLLILASMINQFTLGLVHANQALGNIKWFSLFASCIRIMSLPISCLLLYLKYPAVIAIVVFTICETLASISRIIILGKISSFTSIEFLRDFFVHVLPPFLIALLFCYLFGRLFQGIWGLIASICLNALIYASLMYLMGLTKEEKDSVDTVIRSVLAFFRIKSVND